MSYFWFITYSQYANFNTLAYGDTYGFGYPLWSHFIRYPFKGWNEDISAWSCEDSLPMIESSINCGSLESLDSGSPGRLAQSTESGAEKRWIFSIGNYVNQRMLKPFHDWLMKV